MAKRIKLSKAAQQRRRDIDNAKKRYRRQAERYENDAKKLPVDSKERRVFEAAAEQLRERASDLNGINVRKRLNPEQSALVKDSKNYLASSMTNEWARGEALGKLRLSGSNLGHRFYALTENIWAGIPSNGLGDDRRLNAVRRAVASDKEIRKKYGSRPNANDLIEIVAELYGGDMEEPYQSGDSDSVAMMTGIRRVIRQYG